VSAIRIEAVELRRVELPLVRPFRTAHGTLDRRTALLVRVRAGGVDGWGECGADVRPDYTSEYVDGAAAVLREHLVPGLLAGGPLDGRGVAPRLAWVAGHRMAKAALEAAVLDAELRTAGRSLAQHLGAVRTDVDAGVAVGIPAGIPELLDVVEGHLDEGYRRVKLKIEPGWDVEPVAAVRDKLGAALALQVDGNAAYTAADLDHLATLDRFDLLLVEQPFAADDLLTHASLAQRMATPVCLDESVTSARTAATALALGACSVVNIKPGRVGGVLEAVAIHDLCRAQDVPVWVGGLLETGIGRAVNVALAGLAGFTLPGDLSASARYFDPDLTEPFVLEDGRLHVPAGAGIGVEPDPERLAAHTIETETLHA
jgi:O-succinylbenzoate synthase